jgi:hypothetical protein
MSTGDTKPGEKYASLLQGVPVFVLVLGYGRMVLPPKSVFRLRCPRPLCRLVETQAPFSQVGQFGFLIMGAPLCHT